jgi:hypothetical protein
VAVSIKNDNKNFDVSIFVSCKKEFMINKIYTVGHSNHEINYFIELIKYFNISCIVDVRSIAASSYNPQFNKEFLSESLKKSNIVYMHFAEEFGARHTNPDLLDEAGKVDFDKVRKSSNFQNGIERLCKGIDKGFTIALMCSEGEPFDCHRFSMISVALEKCGFEVNHILKDKSIKTNTDIERQLLKKYDKKIPKPSVFEPDISLEQQLKVAYRLRNQEIAYSPYSEISQEDYD